MNAVYFTFFWSSLRLNKHTLPKYLKYMNLTNVTDKYAKIFAPLNILIHLLCILKFSSIFISEITPAVLNYSFQMEPEG